MLNSQFKKKENMLNSEKLIIMLVKAMLLSSILIIYKGKNVEFSVQKEEKNVEF